MMLTTVQFGHTPPPKKAPKLQQQPAPKVLPRTGATQQAHPAEEKQADAEKVQDSAAMPLPDFKQEPQGHICPFKNAVNLQTPGNSEDNLAEAGQKSKPVRVHRNGCYYLEYNDGKLVYDDITYYNRRDGRQYKKGDVVKPGNSDSN